MADYAATSGAGKAGASPAVNASTVSPTYSPPAGTTAEQSRVDELTRALAGNIRNLPQTADAIRSSTIQNDPVNPALYGQYSDAIMQLYQHDQQLGERYSQPGGEMYLEDPVARERAIQASRGPMVGNLGAISQMIGTRRQVLGDAATRGLEIYKSGLEAQKLELDAAERALQRKLDFDAKQTTKTTSANKDTADIWMKILASPGVDTEDDVWNLINNNDAAWRAAGIDVDQLWKWHKELVDKATTSQYGPGPVPPEARKGIAIPGVKIGQATTGQRQLTADEISAGVLTTDTDDVRNKKVAEYLPKKQIKEVVAAKIKELIKDGWTREEIEKNLSEAEYNPKDYEVELSLAPTGGKKGVIPDWIPFVGKY